MRMKIDFREQKVVICGLQGSGKTTLAKKLVQNKKTLVYTPHTDEWKDMPDNILLYKAKSFYDDIEKFISLAKKLKNKIDGVVIDEFDMLYRYNHDIKREMNDFIINHRHYHLFLIAITRRPQDIPSKIFESSKYIISFALQSPNAIKKFNDVYPQLGEMIKNLSYENREFIIKEIGKEPIKLSSLMLKFQ